MENNLFITGGTGFWGKNILKQLLENESNFYRFNQIVVLTRDKAVFLTNYPEFDNSKIEYINGDVRNFVFNRTDFTYILHLATDASKDLNDSNPLEMMDVILNGTKRVLEFAKLQSNLKKLLFASSGAVYGHIPENINRVKEEDRFDLDFTNPVNTYAQSKRTAEMMCYIHIQKYKMPIIIARGFAFVGLYLPQDTHFAIGNFIKQAKEEGKITIKSDGTARRSYMNSIDLAKVLLDLLLKERLVHNIFNIGSEEGKTLNDWASIISLKYNNVPIEILNNKNNTVESRSNFIPDINRLKKDISNISLIKETEKYN